MGVDLCAWLAGLKERLLVGRILCEELPSGNQYLPERDEVSPWAFAASDHDAEVAAAQKNPPPRSGLRLCRLACGVRPNVRGERA